MVEFELWVPSSFEFAGSGADGSSVTVVLAAAEVRIEVRGGGGRHAFLNPQLIALNCVNTFSWFNLIP